MTPAFHAASGYQEKTSTDWTLLFTNQISPGVMRPGITVGRTSGLDLNDGYTLWLFHTWSWVDLDGQCSYPLPVYRAS